MSVIEASNYLVSGSESNDSAICFVPTFDDSSATEHEAGDFETTSIGSTLTTIFVLYVVIVLFLKAIAWCQFICTWNFIMRTHRSLDDSCSTTRTTLTSVLGRSFGAKGSSTPLCSEVVLQDECPICLVGFVDDEDHEHEHDDDGRPKRYNDYIITCACCKKNFHNECLVMWLERGSSCPCCRRDLVGGSKHPHHQTQQQHRSWMADLSIFVGFPPR